MIQVDVIEDIPVDFPQVGIDLNLLNQPALPLSLQFLRKKGVSLPTLTQAILDAMGRCHCRRMVLESDRKSNELSPSGAKCLAWLVVTVQLL